MAEALLSISLEMAISKLVIFIEKQIRLTASASDDVREIQYKFHSIKAVLMDAERKQFTDEGVRAWLLKLKGVALDIEDVAEEWQISSDYVNSYKVGVQLKEIRKRLDEIHGDRLMSSFSSTSVGGGSETIRVSSDWRQTSSLVEESQIIGRDEDKKTVTSWLVSDEEDRQQEEVHVTAIVGVGGLGKTSLAQKIFNDPKVKDHFNRDLYWVCVSDVFDLIKLTKDILEVVNVKGAAASSTQLDVLQKELIFSLSGKRYLLVLDDVWNEDDEKWNMLRLCLKGGARGSRILVTTRSEKVAGIMNAACIHNLEGLSADLSWKLFCSRAFPGKKPEEFAEFERIGREIVTRCKGVPLSIRVMGSTMKEKRRMADWENILNSEMWSLPEVKARILPVLQISYYNLPPNLKQCFAHCAIYEKDTVMKKNELVNLWAAQGFIRPEGNRVIEDIGEGYFNDLAARSMFQEFSVDDKGHTTCKMHDLLHDLATVITQDECYISTGSKKSNPQCPSIGGVRHASLFLYGDNASISLASCPAKKLRTLFVNNLHEIRSIHEKLFREARFLRALVFRICGGIKVLPKAIGKLEHLRYLDLSRTKIKKLPDALGKMQHLRYLDLSRTEIEELPESVSHLVNLHTLDLNYCTRLKILCRGICKIIGLRHLYIENTFRLKYLPKGIGKLTSLQSLCKFRVGDDKGEYGGIDELEELNSVQGRLEIEALDRVSEAEQATRAQLCRKQYVRTLVLDISSYGRDVEDDKEEERIKVLECLRPHPNLQDFSLRGHSVSKLRLPSWLGDPSFSDLSRLDIFGFRNWEPNNTMPGLGKLPALKCLYISDVGIRKLGDEFYYGIGMMSAGRGVAFPKLESLTLQEMDELEGWELTGEADAYWIMPSLLQLQVSHCPKLQLLPSHLTIAAMPPPPPISSSSSSSSSVLEESENYRHELKPLQSDRLLKPLERLEINSCEKLQRLPHSLGQLKKLRSLEICFATEPTFLPDSLGELDSLENLRIDACHSLESLPDSLGGLKKLKSLTITRLEKLKSLPDSLGQLKSLENLKIHACHNLESLLDSFGGLKKLKSLTITSLEKLESPPDSLGRLESLENLKIEACHILKSLPHSLGGLKNLKSLTITRLEKLKSPPDSLGQLESLEKLTMERCYELESLPDSLGGLKKLKSVTITRLEKLKSLPDSLGQLESLEKLTIQDCYGLESLPHSLGGLNKLTSLTITSLGKLESLPDSLGQLASLKYLNIYDCHKLTCLPDSLGRLQKLLGLYILGCPLLPYRRGGRRQDWPNISHIPTIYIDHHRLC